MRGNRAIWGIALGLAAWGSAPAAMAGEGSCPEPEGALDYQRLRIVYRMDIDLSGCPWYQGEPIQMSATLRRSDGILPDDEATAETVCASLAPSPAPAPQSAGGGAGTCSVAVELEHPPVEVADYSGEITFPGPDGVRRVTYEGSCDSILVMGGCD